MDLLLWILQWVLATAFLAAGAMKVATPIGRLREQPGMGWTTDFSPAQVKLIGLVEVAGAVGVVVPALVDVAPWLVPLAAAGLTLDMLGAFSTHLKRNDPPSMRTPSIVLGLLAAVVAIGRYWIEPLG